MRCGMLLLVFFATMAPVIADEKPKSADAKTEELIRQLGSDDFKAREKACKDLISLGVPALEKLREAAKFIDPEVSRRADECIKQIEINQKVAFLIEGLRDPDPKRRAESANELAGFGSHARPAVPALIKLLDDPEPQVRIRGVYSLGLLGPDVAKEGGSKMVAIMKDKGQSEDIRWATAINLARLGQCRDEAVPILLSWLESGSPKLGQVAASTLGKLGDKDSKVVPALLKALKDKSLQSSAAGSLGLLAKDPNSCVPALTEALRSFKPDKPDEDPRRAILFALGRFGPKAATAVPEISKIAGDTKEAGTEGLFLRSDAIKVLGEIGPEAQEAVPLLTRILKSKDIEDQLFLAGPAIETLEKISKKGS